MARSKTEKSKGEGSAKGQKAGARKPAMTTRKARSSADKTEKPRENAKSRETTIRAKGGAREDVRDGRTASVTAKPGTGVSKTRAATRVTKTDGAPRAEAPRERAKVSTSRGLTAGNKTAQPPREPRTTREPSAKKSAAPADAHETTAAPPTTLSDEEQIGSAKYLPRDLPPRLFEEERFIFPETYGVNRLRLLARDPQWLFAHWDVDPRSLGELRQDLGQRAAAVSRLTLRISDPDAGGTKVIHVPEGSRSWYVRTDLALRSYRAELGFTLPSGEFRKVAESATVRPPWSGPSKEKARGRVRYDQVDPRSAPLAGPTDAEASAIVIDPGPWRPEATSENELSKGTPDTHREEIGERGGASETYRR